MRQYAGFASAEETNERFRHLLAARADRALGRLRPARRSSASIRTIRWRAARSAAPASRSTRSTTCCASSTASRWASVSTSMTINAPAAVLLLLYELAGAEHGVAPADLRGTVQNDVLKEYAARGNYIFPPRPSMRLTVDALPLLQRAPAALQHDLDLRLPHPRGRLERRAGARLHARQRHRLRRGGAGRRPLGRRLRAAPVVLLQRPQRRLRRGRQVPRRAPDLGHAHARALRRARRALARAALPRADGRLDADRAGAADERRARGAAGASRRRRAAASRCTRTATTRRSRCRPSAPRRSPCVRSRCCCTSRASRPCPIRSAARSTSRALTDEIEREARALIAEIDERGGAVAAIESGWVKGRIEDEAFAQQRAIERGESVIVGVNRYPDPPGLRHRAAGRHARERAAADRPAAGRARRRGTRRPAAPRWRRSAPRRETASAPLLEPLRAALAARCTVGEVCGALRAEWGSYDSQVSDGR